MGSVAQVGREGWGARDADGSRLRTRSTDIIDRVYVHYSAAPAPGDGSIDPGVVHQATCEQLRAIQRDHMDRRGWADIAYHYAVSPDGLVYDCRRESWQGAGVTDDNATSLHVVVLTDGELTARAEYGLGWLVAAIRVGHGTDLMILTHREHDATGCPGDQVQRYVSEHRTADSTIGDPAAWSTDLVAGSVASDGATVAEGDVAVSAAPTFDPASQRTLRNGCTGTDVVLLQVLLDQHGFPPADSLDEVGSYDGIFGLKSTVAVKAYQFATGLYVDGVVGPITWQSLAG